MKFIIKYIDSNTALEIIDAFESISEAIETGKTNTNIEYILLSIEGEEFPKLIYTKNLRCLVGE